MLSCECYSAWVSSNLNSCLVESSTQAAIGCHATIHVDLQVGHAALRFTNKAVEVGRSRINIGNCGNIFQIT